MTADRCLRVRSLRPLWALLIAAAIAAVTPLTGPGAAAAAPIPAAQPAPSGPTDTPTIRIQHQDLDVEPDGAFTAFVEVSGAPDGSELAIDLYDRVEDANALVKSSVGEPIHSLATFPLIPLAATTDGNAVGAFSIQLRDHGSNPEPWSWRLDEAGVYPVRVRLRDAMGAALGDIVTYLVRRPSADQNLPKVHLALLANIDDRSDDPTAPHVVTGDQIDNLLAAFDDHPDLPVTVRVDAATGRRLTDEPTAADGLNRLRSVLDRSGSTLLGSPYVQIDPRSLVANGFADDLAIQRGLGDASVTELTGVTPEATWWLDTTLDPATAGALASAGLRHVITAGAVVGAPGASAPRKLPGADGRLSVATTGLVSLPTTSTDPTGDVVRALAQATAAAQIQGVADATTVLPITTDTDTDLIAALLDRLDESSTLRTVSSVEGLFLVASEAGQATLPVLPAPQQLHDYVNARRDLSGLVTSFRPMIDDPDRLDSEIALATAESDAVTLTEAERSNDIRQVSAGIRAELAGVTTAETERVTLGARDAEIPVSISSDAKVPLKVIVELASSDRLEFRDKDIEVTLNPEGTTVVNIPVRTRASGDTPMTVTVRSPDRQIILSQSRYSVRSTAVSGVGLVLTVGAAGFLALWWGRHILRSRRERTKVTSA